MAWKLIVIAASGVVLPAVQSPPGGGGTPQDAPPIVVVGPDADIVVTGPRPAIRGGLWQFVRSGTLTYGASEASSPLSNPYRFTMCLPDDDLEAALRKVAGERSAMPRDNRCSSFRLNVGSGKITGTRTCVRPLPFEGIEPKHNRLNLSGGYDAKRLRINFMSEDRFDGLERGGGVGWNPRRPVGRRWRVEAVRLGDCPAERRRDQRNVDEAVSRLFDPLAIDDTKSLGY